MPLFKLLSLEEFHYDSAIFTTVLGLSLPTGRALETTQLEKLELLVGVGVGRRIEHRRAWAWLWYFESELLELTVAFLEAWEVGLSSESLFARNAMAIEIQHGTVSLRIVRVRGNQLHFESIMAVNANVVLALLQY